MAINLSFSFPNLHMVKSSYLKASHSVCSIGEGISKGLYGCVSSFFNPFYPSEGQKSFSFIALDKDNIGIINQLSSFGKTLESYHPGKIKQLFAKFQEKYESHEDRENLTPLKKAHEETLEKFTKTHEKVLRKMELTDQRKNEIKTSFEEFSGKFKSLLTTYDQKKLKDASTLLDNFNETIMQSNQLYIELGKVIRYIEKQNVFILHEFQRQFDLRILQKLEKQFKPKIPEDQGFNQIVKKNAQRAVLFDLIADASVILEALSPEAGSNNISLFKNNRCKNELTKTILQNSKEITSFIKTDELEHEIMRFYLSGARRSSCKNLAEKLKTLLQGPSYLFTKREKKTLDCLQKDLSAISYGKFFHKETLQERLNKCQDFIKELLPKETVFTQITTSLSTLEFSIIGKKIALADHQKTLLFLNSFIDNPKIPFRDNEKAGFKALRDQLSSIIPDQDIPENEATALRAASRICRNTIKEIENRPPSKEGNKLAIEQELQKLAKHATSLSFMMLIDRSLFNPTRDSLFYRKIIQKAEETSSCPKQLLLAQLKTQGFPTWKILSAKVYFFVTKHLKVESYVHKIISRAMTNYSEILYQKLDQEQNQDQFRLLSQNILENVAMYFQLLSSGCSNAKEEVGRFPYQITQRIIKQLLLLKPEENEATLRELNLNDLYSKLIDDLAERSESRLLKWIVSWLDKYNLVSSLIEIGTDSFINPAPNATASTLDLLIRDGLKVLYKKLQQPTESDSQEEQDIPNATAKAVAENLIRTLNEYRAIQQVASYTKIIVANQKHIEELRSQAPHLEGIIDKQIKDLEAINHTIFLKLDVLKTPALKGEKRQSLSVSSAIKNGLEKISEITLLSPALEENTVLSAGEIASDKTRMRIKPIVDDVIREKLTSALTKLLNTPPSEELIYDWIYQGLFIANQAIERPKENKETQKAVEEEISELLSDISFSIASTVPAAIAKKWTGINRSSTIAENIPYDVPSLISPVIQERLQDIVSLSKQKVLYQPELVAQLGRRIILPVGPVATT